MKKIPSKKSRHPKQKTTPSTKKRWIILTFLAIVIVGVGAIKINNQRIINNEKAHFTQSQKDLEALSTRITSRFGVSDMFKQSSSCARSHQKLTTGPLSCDVGFTMTLRAYDLEDAQAKIKLISDYINEQQDILKFRKYSSDNLTLDALRDPKDYSQKSATYLERHTKMVCGITFTYLDSTNTNNYANMVSHAPMTLLLDVGCGGGARMPYYQET